MPIISVGMISGSGIMLVMLVMHSSVDGAIASHDDADLLPVRRRFFGRSQRRSFPTEMSDGPIV